MDTKDIKRAFIVSDTHFGARSASVEWLDEMMDYFYNDFIPKVKANYKPGDVIIHCGDVFDNRQSINLQVLHRTIQLFNELTTIVDHVYVIVGNHDVMRKTSNDIASTDSLQYIPNITIFKEPELLKICNNNVLLMPWRTDMTEERATLAKYKNLQYLFCHSTINNMRFDKTRNIEGEGIDIEELKEFKKVYSGHIHWGQSRNNVVMVGNPYQMTRSDSGNSKGFYLLDFETDEQTFFENLTSPKFEKLFFEKYLDADFDSFLQMCTNNRVDIYIQSKYLVNYNINALIEPLTKVTKNIELIPSEEVYTVELEDELDYSNSLDFINLATKYVESLTLDKSIKTLVLPKIKDYYKKVLNPNEGI